MTNRQWFRFIIIIFILQHQYWICNTNCEIDRAKKGDSKNGMRSAILFMKIGKFLFHGINLRICLSLKRFLKNDIFQYRLIIVEKALDFGDAAIILRTILVYVSQLNYAEKHFSIQLNLSSFSHLNFIKIPNVVFSFSKSIAVLWFDFFIKI